MGTTEQEAIDKTEYLKTHRLDKKKGWVSEPEFGTKEYYEQKEIRVYWWNMGHKKLDFSGTYKDYLKKVGIKPYPIVKPNKVGVRFKIGLSSSSLTLDTWRCDYGESCDRAILVYLTLLGDKARLEGHRASYNVNW